MRQEGGRSRGHTHSRAAQSRWAPWALVVLVASACGSRDEKFSAETNDEYTEPLREVTIGEPNGRITTISAAGAAFAAEDGGVGEMPDGGSSFPDVAVDAPDPTGGGAGSFGVGGSSGSAGAFGSGGSFGGSVGAGGRAGFSGSGGSFAGSFSTGTGVGGSTTGTGGSFGGSFGVGGSAGKGGIIDGGIGPTGPSGFWRFDDCSPASNFLLDSSGNGAHAQHALNRFCVPGISGLGVNFVDKKDIVQVPDMPQFTVGPRVAVAAWVNPTAISADHPIVLKRLDNKTAFSLGIHKGNLEMSVVLTTGKTFISRAPIEMNTWSHVAGMYDGRFVFLFINGEQVGQIAAAGTLRNVLAPIRIGATTQSQHFDGIIDDVWLSTNVVRKEDLIALSCVRRPSTIAVTPAKAGPVPFETPVNYQIQVTNQDLGFCGQSQYQTFFDPSVPPSGRDGGAPGGDGGAPLSNVGINAVFNPQFMILPPGGTATISADVTATEDAEPGLHLLGFGVVKFGQFFEFLRAEALFELAEPTGCFVRTRRELMITNTSVVDDPVRTAFNPSVPTDHPESRGVWTFGRLMRDMAPTPEDAPDMTERLFRTWMSDQTVNGFTISARPAIQQVLFDNWPRTPDGKLDLDRSPLMLQAIVNRMDVRNLGQGKAGEGRFVFAVVSPFGPFEFTVIVEYDLPAETEDDVLEWGNLWHSLSSHPFPSEAYNSALEAITLRFSGRNASPGRVNNSALSQLRTNEIALSFNGVWELREFQLSGESGFLEPSTIKLTPDLSFNGSFQLGDFVNQNESAIIAEQHTVPDQFQGLPFAAGSVFNGQIFWSAPNIANNEARHKLSLNTCNGCHGPEAGSGFLQISPRFGQGGEAFLSPFLTGTSVFDPFSGQVRQLNDLARRRADLVSLVCTPTTLRSLRSTAPGATSIAKGIGRVH